MDIQKAASYGWDRKRSISMVLRNLTSREFRDHSRLDNYLADRPTPEIYYMTTKERIIRDKGFPYRCKGTGDIVVYHGHSEESGEFKEFAGLEMSPEFQKCNGYKEFVFKMAEHLGAKRENVFLRRDGIIYDSVSGNLWNGAETIGHKEIADLADYFQKEFVSKHEKGAKTRIFVAYENLTPEEILKMTYNPKKVVSFTIE